MGEIALLFGEAAQMESTHELASCRFVAAGD